MNVHGAYVLICGDTRCVPGCFNCCRQRIHAFIVPVIPVLCFTKSYLDLVNKKILFNLVSCLALGKLLVSGVLAQYTSSLESTNHSYSPSPTL